MQNLHELGIVSTGRPVTLAADLRNVTVAKWPIKEVKVLKEARLCPPLRAPLPTSAEPAHGLRFSE
jgi:hypothetical protein